MCVARRPRHLFDVQKTVLYEVRHGHLAHPHRRCLEVFAIAREFHKPEAQLCKMVNRTFEPQRLKQLHEVYKIEKSASFLRPSFSADLAPPEFNEVERKFDRVKRLD